MTLMMGVPPFIKEGHFTEPPVFMLESPSHVHRAAQAAEPLGSRGGVLPPPDQDDAEEAAEASHKRVRQCRLRRTCKDS